MYFSTSFKGPTDKQFEKQFINKASFSHTFQVADTDFIYLTFQSEHGCLIDLKITYLDLPDLSQAEKRLAQIKHKQSEAGKEEEKVLTE